ncbi:hypothetical protein N7456_005499 [Penicillium angulare]|uniref:Zn(2)-C6 fungal-type domain-containing protein n=1 Tax=Penicillium angulare TaxID=116970 RepID=A0A9W9KJD4_9EURO|nr:hypothetical protein N7456_005499 [Penicillium angulare]
MATERKNSNLPDPRAGQPPTSLPKSRRVLACVACQQRKVKCDRKFPCANCLRQRIPCIPSGQPRPRKRRFPERELLTRLRRYEDLLRENKVKFEPLHGHKNPNDDMDEGISEDEGHDDLTESSPATSARSENAYEPKNLWKAMSQDFRYSNKPSKSAKDACRMREALGKMTWDQRFADDDHIILGSRRGLVDLAALHPEPVHIFRLWQIYLENVNPLFKVTHTPSLQGKVIEASSNTANIEPRLEALMFSVYCMAIQSLAAETCQSIFGLSRDDLLTKYQFGCQQALLNCQFLRSDDRECLTALFLFLYSLQSNTNPRTLSSMIALAIRMAQRMGIHSESFLSRCTVFEAEMRRRVWWSLMLFDSRVGELSEMKTSSMNPTWDCKPPMNVNDSDLWVEMKEPPVARGKVSEAIFVVVRSQIADHVRHSSFHLEFLNPALKHIANMLHSGGDVAALDKKIKDEYLKFCDEENPLHFMTIWALRAQVSKYYLLECYARFLDSTSPPTDTESDAFVEHALCMLYSDTKIYTSPLSKGFIWLLQYYFPFPAFIHVMHDLKKRPTGGHAARAWTVMNDNFEARFVSVDEVHAPLFAMFANVILRKWEGIEEILKQSGASTVPPKLVTSIKRKLSDIANQTPDPNAEEPDYRLGTIFDQISVPATMGMGANMGMSMGVGMGADAGLGAECLFDGLGGQSTLFGPDPRLFPNIDQPALTADMNHLTWMSMMWGSRERLGWRDP